MLAYLSPRKIVFLIGLFSLVLIAGAWFFQLVIGLQPCPLCYLQRWPHYIAMPVALLGFILLGQEGWLRQFGWLCLLTLFGLMLWSAGLGIYHAGVEWQFWAGPDTCSGNVIQPLPETTEDLFAALEEPRVPSCGDIAWSFLGLSLAGYNALASLFMALLAGLGLMSFRRGWAGSAIK